MYSNIDKEKNQSLYGILFYSRKFLTYRELLVDKA